MELNIRRRIDATKLAMAMNYTGASVGVNESGEAKVDHSKDFKGEKSNFKNKKPQESNNKISSAVISTRYVDEDGNLILETNDGSDDVIVVPEKMETKFRKVFDAAGYYYKNSKKANNWWKAEILGGLKELKLLDNTSSQYSRQRLINYFQKSTFKNWI